MCIPTMYCSFLKPDIVIGTRLPLFHLFALPTLWVKIELVARKNVAGQK